MPEQDQGTDPDHPEAALASIPFQAVEVPEPVFQTATGPDHLSSDDAALTPIFHALARRVGEPEEQSRVDAAATPGPPGPAHPTGSRLRAIPGERALAEPRLPGDAAWSPARARHAAPVGGAITAPTVALTAAPSLGAHRSAPGARSTLGAHRSGPGAGSTVGAHRSGPGAHRAAEPTAEARCGGGRHRALRAVSHGTG